MSNLINSKKYAFCLSTDKDLSGVIYMELPPRNPGCRSEFVRCWITPFEKAMLSTGMYQEPITAIILNKSLNYPEIEWGDEVVIRGRKPGEDPILDKQWLLDVLYGKICPQPKDKSDLKRTFQKIYGQKRIKKDVSDQSES